MHSEDNSNIIFDQNSTVTFSNNTADYGGAVRLIHHSICHFTGESTVKFQNNGLSKYGGALYIHITCAVEFMKYTTVLFYNNSAIDNGGAIFFKIN